MGEIGRSRLQRAIQLVWGVALLCAGGLLVWGSAWPVSEFITNIRDHQYTALLVWIVLLLLGFIYMGTAVMLFRIRRGWAIGWRMALGVLTGLVVWFILDILLTPLVPLEYVYRFSWIKYVVPVLIAGGLAGCVARRYGLVWGGVIGLVRQFVDLWAIWLLSQSVDMSRHPISSITKILEDWNMTSSFLTETSIVLLIGMASGYVGQFLAHRVLRHRKSLDHEISSASVKP